jgi:hypothetical protein
MAQLPARAQVGFYDSFACLRPTPRRGCREITLDVVDITWHLDACVRFPTLDLLCMSITRDCTQASDFANHPARTSATPS